MTTTPGYDLNELAALEAKATKGPWAEIVEDPGFTTAGIDAPDGSAVLWISTQGAEDGMPRGENVAFTVAARNALPSIIADLRTLRALQEQYVRDIRSRRGHPSPEEMQVLADYEAYRSGLPVPDRVREERHAVLEMLRELAEKGGICAECGRTTAIACAGARWLRDDHAPDCKLDALLAKQRERCVTLAEGV